MSNKVLRYISPPISTPFILLGLLTLAIVVWLRSGAVEDTTYLLFLVCNYLSWSFLLPFIYGAILHYESTSVQTFTFLTKAITLILIHFFISNLCYYIILELFVTGYQQPSFTLLREIIIPSILLRAVDFTLILGILSWVHRSKELNDQKLRLLETEADLDKAKLKTLQSQLNPHFLFNTLHTINNLIGRSDDKAREITIKISTLLRRVLITNEKEVHTLQEELEVVFLYLAIEEERFRDRLTTNMFIDESLLDYNVPTFILQPLIENSFKHGISQVEGEVALSVKLHKDETDKFLLIAIKNDMPNKSISKDRSTGIGLKNLEARLSTYFKDNFSFEAEQSSGSVFEVQVKLPLSR